MNLSTPKNKNYEICQNTMSFANGAQNCNNKQENVYICNL